MGNKRPRLEDTSSEESDNEDEDSLMLNLSTCNRDTCRRPRPRRRRRLPNQVFRERRRRRLLVMRRLKRRRCNSFSSGNSSDTSSSEAELSEADVARRRRSRYRNHVASTFILEKDKSCSFRFTWRDILFSGLSVVILIMFMETHIETWITGRPPHRFSCYLCGMVICCALWCLLMMQEDFDEDLRERN